MNRDNLPPLTLPDKINLQVKIKFKNYQGRIWRKFILIHAQMRVRLGDERFLEYLEQCKEPPVYKLPENILTSLDPKNYRNE